MKNSNTPPSTRAGRGHPPNMLAALLLAAAAWATAPGAAAQTMSLDASAGLATAYLFRGAELGDGAAAFYGDIFWNIGAVDEDGSSAYAGVWLSSGDTALGSEYDLVAGYRWQRDWFGIDVGVVSYVYPDVISNLSGIEATTATASDTSVETLLSNHRVVSEREQNFDVGQFSEVYLGLSGGPVSLYYYDNVAGNTGYSYLALSWDIGDFSLLIGDHATMSPGDEYQHVDLSWSYNDYLSLTLSKRFSEGIDVEGTQNDTVAVLSLSLPINLDALQ